MTDVDVTKNGRAWHAQVDGRPAGMLVYRESSDGSAVVLVHTEVDDRFEGKGVGGRLVRTALDELAAAGRAVRPDCPFVRAWLRRHPDHPVQVVRRS